MKKMNLCDACAADHGLTDGDAYPMVEKIMDDIPEHVELLADDSATVCERCGFSLEDYRKVGRLGCSYCYTTFANEIQGGLEKLHSGITHEGKVPDGIVQDIVREKELQSMRDELEAAIAAEDFEKAAKLRDSIKERES